jgi:tRNA ligase
VSHSERGEYWLEEHVKKVGKTKEDLAKELFERNLTAVAEVRSHLLSLSPVKCADEPSSQLCDDSFEEHVLAYSSELTGLHLHGLNHNSPILSTLPSSEVSAFAKDRGFIPTTYSTFPSVPAVKTYCDTVQQDGGVEGPDGKIHPVEGFVVRGHRKGGAPGEAFFWKVKYDEPYLMYREWRELTRKLLKDLDGVNLNKIKSEESRLYVWWVRREIENDREKFAPWEHGKGIIKTRDEFLAWSKTKEAKTAKRELGIQVEMDEEERRNRKFHKTLLVPVAIQGCGSSSSSPLPLSTVADRLLPQARPLSDSSSPTSSDGVTFKATTSFRRSRLLTSSRRSRNRWRSRTSSSPTSALLSPLSSLLFFFTDSSLSLHRNNHTVKHRTDLTSLVASLAPATNVRLVALVWPIDSDTLPRDKFHALCSSRIVDRGDNHQSLRAGEGHEQAVWQFLGQYNAFDLSGNAADSKFDEVIEMRAEWTQEEALQRALGELAKIDGVLPSGVELPLSKEKVKEAIDHARDWKTTVKKEAAAETKPRAAKSQAPRYYGLSVSVDLEKLVLEHLPQQDKDNKSSLWNTLTKSSRIERHPHVTLVHNAELASTDEAFKAKKQALWDRYSSLVDAATFLSDQTTAEDVKRASEATAKLEVELTLGPRLVWDSRAMSLEVSALRCKVPGKEGEPPLIELVDGRSAHITIGTKASDVRPVEGKWLMEAAQNGETESKEGGKIHSVTLPEGIQVPAKLAGLS